MTAAFVAFRIAQTVIVLAALGALAWGGVRLLDELRFLWTSAPVRAQVVAYRETTEQSAVNPIDDRLRSRRFETVWVRYPTFRFRSPVDGRLHRSASTFGYDDGRFPVGQEVTLRASTRAPDEARHSDPVRRFLLPGLLLAIGLFGTILPVLLWHLPDEFLGVPPASGPSLLRKAAPLGAAIVVTGLLAVAAWARWSMPWMTLRHWVLLLRNQVSYADDLWRHAPEPGQPLSVPEARLARLPVFGSQAACAAVGTAIEERRHDDLKRYLAAYRDPAIRFPIARGARFFFASAARARDADAVRMLAEAGLDPREDAWALETAVEQGSGGVVRALAALGVAPADPFAARRLVDSALYHDDDDTLLALVEVGWADPAATRDARPWGGYEQGTLLDVALARGFARSARELERRGATTAAPLLARLVAGDTDGMRALLPERAWQWARVFEAPLLVHAVRAGQGALVRRLVDLGADPAERSRTGEELTPLGEAVARGDLATVRYLAGLPGAAAWLNPRGRIAPVGFAAGAGRWDLVRALVEAGADPNARYTDPRVDTGLPGATPLHRAAWDGKVDEVEYLLAHGADPRAEADRKFLPIEAARDDAVHAAIARAGGDPR